VIPYTNESDVIQINGLTIEGRLDRVSLYGSIDLTRDKIGLKQARQLNDLINLVLLRLEEADRAGDLPDEIPIEQTVSVPNPLL
jgi:hypothetical protein